MINKFKEIANNIIEFMLEKETTIKPKDSITDRIYKLMKKFDFYKNKKDITKLDKTMEEVIHHLSISPTLKISKNEIDYFVRDPMLVDDMKETLIFLAAKENQQLAYNLISKYKPVVQQTTIVKMIDNDNYSAFEMLLLNPDTKYSGNREDIFNSKIIVAFACEQKKMDFLKFGASVPDKSDTYYHDILKHATKHNWTEGVDFIASHYKDKISKEEFAQLANESISMQQYEIANRLKEISPESNIVIPENSLENKIKEIRQKNIGKTNTKNVLKS